MKSEVGTCEKDNVHLFVPLKYNHGVRHEKWHKFMYLLNMKNKKGEDLGIKIAHH